MEAVSPGIALRGARASSCRQSRCSSTPSSRRITPKYLISTVPALRSCCAWPSGTCRGSGLESRRWCFWQGLPLRSTFRNGGPTGSSSSTISPSSPGPSTATARTEEMGFSSTTARETRSNPDERALRCTASPQRPGHRSSDRTRTVASARVQRVGSRPMTDVDEQGRTGTSPRGRRGRDPAGFSGLPARHLRVEVRGARRIRPEGDRGTRRR